MRKPNLSDIDLITRKTSVLLNVSEDIIDKVMSFEKKSVKEATYKYKTVEITNFAVLSARPRKVKSEIKQRENFILSYTRRLEDTIDEKEKTTLEKKIKSTTSDLEYLKTKL